MLAKYPFLQLAASVLVLSLAAWIGARRFRRLREAVAGLSDEFGLVQGATFTLLGLIIGFSFSMAVSRYDQRKNYEEEEANAIGTEYLRADLLAPAQAAQVRTLLVQYLDERILYYTTRDDEELARIGHDTDALQAKMWAVVRDGAAAQPTPPMALAVSGMNDVINTQGYTQAAWRNRIPLPAWLLMSLIAICTTVLVGVGSAKKAGFNLMLLVLPVVLSIAFFLIADIDSPRRGMIRVVPQNLIGLAQSLRTG
ncbi:MAG TPA: hypothetical protein VMT50_09490 [Steroidobacteraceae bacterium]|nr:hypothetical protein [Steroidobacteraceae bacterium]